MNSEVRVRGWAILTLLSTVGACVEPAPRVYAAFESAPGAKIGSEVLYRGVPVGTVRAISFAEGGVRLTLSLERSDMALRQADTALLKPVGLFGDIVVELLPGPRTAPRLGPDSLVPGRHLRVPTIDPARLADAVERVLAAPDSGESPDSGRQDRSRP